jgi:hypothetical protein
MNYCLNRVENRHIEFQRSPKMIFATLKGLQTVLSGDFQKIFEAFSSQLGGLIQGCFFMNYGSIYEIVNQFPKIQQLNAASERLTGRKMDMGIAAILGDAAKKFKNNYGLTDI